MHIDEYTKIPLEGEEDSYLYIKNKLLGHFIKNVDDPTQKIINEKTGEQYEEISLYQQIWDKEGKRLESPLQGDNADFVWIYGPNGEYKQRLIDLIATEK